MNYWFHLTHWNLFKCLVLCFVLTVTDHSTSKRGCGGEGGGGEFLSERWWWGLREWRGREKGWGGWGGGVISERWRWGLREWRGRGGGGDSYQRDGGGGWENEGEERKGGGGIHIREVVVGVENERMKGKRERRGGGGEHSWPTGVTCWKVCFMYKLLFFRTDLGNTHQYCETQGNNDTWVLYTILC